MIESELIEISLQPGFVQIIGHDARSRRERSFHRRIDSQSALDRFLREQTGREHHARIARVGATGDRRDQHAAVADLALAVVKRIGRRLRIPAPCRASADSRPSRALLRSSPGLDSLVRLSVEAISPSCGCAAVQLHRMFRAKIDISLFRSRHPLTGFCKQRAKSFAEFGQIDPILRTFRSGDARLHIARSSSRSTL